MKLSFSTGFRMTLSALAVVGAAAAQAQAQAPLAPPPVPHSHAQSQTPHMHKHKPHHGSPNSHAHKKGHGKYANPHQHEAAAVAAQRKSGDAPGPHGAQQLNQYERNALNRCAIFKTEDDRRACVERVRQPQISGSVEGGGLIREYTQTVQVPPPSHAAPQGHPHAVHPPVQPIRPQP